MATPPNHKAPRDEPNAYNKRVWHTNYNNNKQMKLATWSCHICTVENEMKYANCLCCGEAKWANQFPDPMIMRNPYLRFGGRLNIPRPPPISQYNMHTNTNTLHRYTHSLQPAPTYPKPATLPPATLPPALILPSLYNNNANNDNTNNSVPKISKKNADLHPLIAAQINSSVPVFKQAVTGIGVAEKNKNKSKKKAKEYDVNNILGEKDWLEISAKELLQNFGKKVSDLDKDRLYYAMQKYITEYPDGPFKGKLFWDRITALTNTTRKWTSWKTHWNEIVKDKHKGTHRWSQLVALKALLRKKSSSDATNNQISTLQTWADKQQKKKEKIQIKKQLVEDEIIERGKRLDVLLDLAIIEKKEKKENKLNINNADNLLKTVPAQTVKVKELKKEPQTAAIVLSNDEKRILTEIKDMIDDIEDEGLLRLDVAQLTGLKHVLYLDSNPKEKATLIAEFTRLDSKYYQNDKVIHKLLKIHSFFSN